jgi:hypothetical protein
MNARAAQSLRRGELQGLGWGNVHWALGLRAESALGALRAEHRQLVVDVDLGAPLIGSVLVLARLSAALGNCERTVVCASVQECPLTAGLRE